MRVAHNSGVEPITRQQALAAGISPYTLAGPRYHRLFRGVYLHAEQRLDLSQWVAGARMILPPDARVTGLTALRLRGLDVGDDLPLHFVTTIHGRRPHAGIVLGNRGSLVTPGGVATPMEAFVEVCLATGLLEAVQIGDRMIHRRLATVEEFAPLLTHPRPRVARAASLVRAGAESVKESHTRLVCVLAGLPEPERQVTITVDGRWIGRVDMLFRAQRVVLEFEGRQHLNDTDQWNRDIARYNELRDAGYRVVQVTSEMLRDPEALVEWIASELARGGWTGPPPRFSGLWRATFLPTVLTGRRSLPAA